MNGGLCITGLYKAYPTDQRRGRQPVPVLSNVSVSISPGTALALVGANGSGKSTLLRLIAGIDKPCAGRITWAGRPRAGAEWRGILGYLSAVTDGAHDRLTGWENLLLAARLHGISHAAAKNSIEDLVVQMDMQGFVHRRAGTYSLGQRQRLALARALVHDPQLILLDEPSTGVDIHGVALVRQMAQRLRTAGKTLIVVSHHPDDILSMADRVLLLKTGHVAFEGSVVDLAARATNGLLEAAIMELIR